MFELIKTIFAMITDIEIAMTCQDKDGRRALWHRIMDWKMEHLYVYIKKLQASRPSIREDGWRDHILKRRALDIYVSQLEWHTEELLHTFCGKYPGRTSCMSIRKNAHQNCIRAYHSWKE